MQKYDIAVIGGGPAGMMAAIRAAECGAQVVILEKKHQPGIKLLMTGKERCNITNNEIDVRNFIEYFENGKFLLSACYHFGVQQTIDFFNQNGLETKVERGRRVFPQSNKAQDVHDLLLKLLNKYGVKIFTDCQINRFTLTGNRISSIVLQNGETSANNIILATGGLSYPKTGATGDGYALAKKVGHTIVKPQPALTPILLAEKFIADLEGISLKNVAVSIYHNNTKKDERFGEALFMGNGISGPIILDISKKVGRLLENGEVKLCIDFKPALGHEKLDNRLIREMTEQHTKQIQNAMRALLPKRIIPILLQLAEIDPEKQCSQISKKERKRLGQLLKEFPLTVRQLVGFKKAVITSGGIALKEIDPGTMRSKIIENLFFAGEIIDIDGPTGGYNLQVCWSTGYLAGESAASHEKKSE